MTEQLFSDGEYIKLGKITAHHGIKGWLKIYSYTDPKQNILSYRQILLFKNISDTTSIVNSSENIWKRVEIDDGRLQGKGIVTHFKAYDNRESAEELIGCTLAIAKTELEKLAKDEYYWVDLIGLKVVNQEGVHLGKVVKLLPTGANDVLVIKSSAKEQEVEGLQKEYLIPYIMGQFILNIDLDTKSMKVDWDINF